MADRFLDFPDAPHTPSRRPFAIVPSDVAALRDLPKAIYVGTGGTIVLRGVDSAADVTLRGVSAGQILDIRASHVRVTGTTAGDLVGLA
ncbi:MAG TPA: hypothetical protein DEP91_05735 [Sphingomonas bacterium]|uniref:Uncharacterized protein n=1 Tax=Sphingomonas bacterium TaxID=1895847 RepID=A0A3D0WAM4_9SPHN|nr:hypothetical protein [Sphingomonas bacterium]